ncbi:MAG: hypothetical protein K2K75_10550 [Muribaculaceae bacterium]|nr:hypothetical protein [Muribaculaceae bacterium]
MQEIKPESGKRFIERICKMVRLLCLLTLFYVALNIKGDEIVYSIERVHNPDSSLSLPEKFDLNNDVTAQIEIIADDIKFVEVEGNAISGIEKHNNRSILYLCDGSRHIRLYSEGNLPLDIDFTRFDDAKRGVKGGEFYLLRIFPKNEKQIVGLGSRILTFKSDEPLDSIIVDGIKWEVKEHISQKLVPFGEYEYKAYSHGLKQLDGTVNVAGGLGSKTVKLNFGK